MLDILAIADRYRHSDAWHKDAIVRHVFRVGGLPGVCALAHAVGTTPTRLVVLDRPFRIFLQRRLTAKQAVVHA